VLTQVDIQNVTGATLSLPMAGGAPGYLIKDLEGLGLVKATLTSTDNAQTDGAQLQGARRDPRNITGKIGFLPDYVTSTVQSLRTDLYDYLAPMSNVVMSFYDDGVVFANIAATVESLDDTRFTDDPEMDFSVMCYGVDFVSPDTTSLSGNTVADTTSMTIDYEGSTDVGIVFTLNVNRTMSDISLTNIRPDNIVQTLNLNGLDLIAGDTLTLVSVPGSKAITRNRVGNVTSVLYSLDSASTWPLLRKGVNLFRAQTSGAAVPYTVDYMAKYAGLK
jgi:hypothetical protein